MDSIPALIFISFSKGKWYCCQDIFWLNVLGCSKMDTFIENAENSEMFLASICYMIVTIGTPWGYMAVRMSTTIRKYVLHFLLGKTHQRKSKLLAELTTRPSPQGLTLRFLTSCLTTTFVSILDKLWVNSPFLVVPNKNLVVPDNRACLHVKPCTRLSAK